MCPCQTDNVSRVLIVHHTVSPPLAELLDIVKKAATTAAAELGTPLELQTRPALTASPLDVLEADAIILGSPVNIGTISGALKHFFDGVYYPSMDETDNLPVGYYLHGNSDASGAAKAVDKIIGALKWRQISAPVLVTSGIDQAVREDLANLAALAVLAATQTSLAQTDGS